jgi:arylamine N-acetyltransferase
MSTPPLPPTLTRAVLAYLNVSAAPPTLALLDTLIAAYVRTVPWESAFRIAKRARTQNTADCPRWPETFWQDAIERGGGGTCFESNYAFFRLLLALGYDGYLTVNNMNANIGCHTAIVITIDGQSWLADVGLPLFIPIPLDPNAPTQRAGALATYHVRPDGESRYVIERNPHPSPYAFTLIDRPVGDEAYRAATTGDYGPGGLFLNRVIVNKVINEQLWRFNSAETPLRLEVFDGGERTEHMITGDVAQVVGEHFGMDVETLRAALAVVAHG